MRLTVDTDDTSIGATSGAQTTSAASLADQRSVLSLANHRQADQVRHQGNLLDAAESANRRRLKAGRTTARDKAPASRIQTDIDEEEDMEERRQRARIHRIVTQERKKARKRVATNASAGLVVRDSRNASAGLVVRDSRNVSAGLVVRDSRDEVENTHDMDTSYDNSYDEPGLLITAPTAATDN